MYLHDAERLLTQHGYRLRRVSGTHRHYYDERNRRVTISLPHGRQTAELPRAIAAELRAKIARNENRPSRAACEESQDATEKGLAIINSPDKRTRQQPRRSQRHQRALSAQSAPATIAYTPPQLTPALPFPVVVANVLALEGCATPDSKRYRYSMPAHTCKTCGGPGAIWRLYAMLTDEEHASCPDDGPDMGAWVAERSKRYPLLIGGHMQPARYRFWLCPQCARELFHLRFDGTSGLADRTEREADKLARIGVHAFSPVGRVILRRSNERDKGLFSGEVFSPGTGGMVDLWYPDGSCWMGADTTRIEDLPGALAATYEAWSMMPGRLSHEFKYLDPRYRDPETGNMPAPCTPVISPEKRASMARWNRAILRAAVLTLRLQEVPGITSEQAEEAFDTLAAQLVAETGTEHESSDSIQVER